MVLFASLVISAKNMHCYCNNDTGREGVNLGVIKGLIVSLGECFLTVGGGTCEMIIETCDPI